MQSKNHMFMQSLCLAEILQIALILSLKSIKNSRLDADLSEASVNPKKNPTSSL